MNYEISFKEMDKLAMKASSKKRRFTLEEMKSQVSRIRNHSISIFKKKLIIK